MSHSSSNSPAIGRIPYQIFRRIIQYVYARDSIYPFHQPMLFPPVSVSHVCRSWRDHLLSDPTMWACLIVPVFKPCAIIELIRRSQSVPLKVSIDLGQFEYSVTPALSTIFEQAHRIEFLNVNIQGFEGGHISEAFSHVLQALVRELLTHLQKPAPELRMFGFRYQNAVLPLHSDFFNTLFCGHAPKLIHMDYYRSDGFPKIRYPVFRNLSTLWIYLPLNVNLDRFLKLLQSFPPHLKTLAVVDRWDRNFCRVLSESDLFSDRTVNLPNLDVLILEVNHWADLMDLILKRVTFPMKMDWRVTSSSDPAEFNPENADGQNSGTSRYPRELFTSYNPRIILLRIAISVDNNNVELYVVDARRSSFSCRALDQRTIKWRCRDLSQFLDGRDFLIESFDFTNVIHLHLEFSSSSTIQIELPKIRALFPSLENFLHRKLEDPFAKLKSCNASFNITGSFVHRDLGLKIKNGHFEIPSGDDFSALDTV